MLLFDQSINVPKCGCGFWSRQADPPHAPVQLREAGHTGGIQHGLDISPAVSEPQSTENMTFLSISFQGQRHQAVQVRT